MGMKLLTPIAQKDARQADVTRQLLRAKEADEIANKANLKLAKSEAEFNAMLAKNRLIWAQEEEEHAKRLKDMESEVNVLEGRKKQALVPIQMYKDEADKIMANAKEYLAKVLTKEEDVDLLTEKLEEKLSEVADRENAVATEEQRQQIAREGIKTQQDTMVNSNKLLTQQMADFEAYKAKEEASLLKRKEEVAMAEINFQAKTDKLKRDNEALRVAQIQVKDQRETLDRALAGIPPIKKTP